MKKIFIVLAMLMSCLLFAKDFTIKTGDSFNVFQVDDVKLNFVSIFEIIPENDNVCKIVIDNETLYLKKGNILHLEYFIQDDSIISKSDYVLDRDKAINEVRQKTGKEPAYSTTRIITEHKVINFDYNKIKTEIIDN